MNPTHRIILNTVVTYARSVIGAALAIFSSRWVLNGLGDVDFGLFSVVGSIIVFITFLNAVMSGSAARHSASALGQEDSPEANRWFTAAFSMHLVLAVVLALAGWQIGQYVIVHYLTIPPDRLAASLWVFQVSLISAFVSMLSVPFIAMFTAKQRIADLAIWNMLLSILMFVLAYVLRYVSTDRLKFYAVGMVCSIVCVQLVQIVWALAAFRECRIHFGQWFDKQRFKEIFSFAGWSLIGNSGMLLRNQGSAILLNIEFGPKVNAAYGIANQVSTQANQLAAAMIGAFSPEVTTSEGRGDRARMLSLAQRASKFGTLLVMLFAVPLMVEMDYVLNLWLAQPPAYSATLCRLILVTFIIDRMSVGSMLAVVAKGEIAAYQATVGAGHILTLPLAWIFLKFGAPPTSVGLAFIITTAAVSAGRVLWVRRLFGIKVREWLRKVLLPCAIVAFSAGGAALAPRLMLSMCFSRLAFAVTISIMVSLLVTWFLAFEKGEREFFKQNLRRLLSSLRFKVSRAIQSY